MPVRFVFTVLVLLLCCVDFMEAKSVNPHHGHGHDIKPMDLIPEHGWKMLEKNIYEKGLKKLTEMFLKLKTTDSGSHLKEIESALKTLAMARKE
uniref:Uncharacterized protein n=1 Tax=Magallana gigas TaxID=29159 RepID=K1R1A4_MAGGI